MNAPPTPNVPIWRANADGTLVFLNDDACTLLQSGRDRLLGRSFFEFVPEPARTRLKQHLAHLRAQTPCQAIDHEIEPSHGGVLTLRWTHFGTFDEQGRLTEIVGVGEALPGVGATPNEALERQILANMAEGVNLARRRDAVIVYANQPFERMFGYGPGELVGRHISVLNASDGLTPALAVADVLQSLERDGLWAGTIRNVRKDGEGFQSHAVITAFEHPEHGEVWLSAQHEVPVRESGEAHEDHRALEELIDSSTAVIYIKDLDGRYLRINRQYEELFDVTNESVCGQTDHALFPAETAERLRANDARVLEHGGPLEFDEVVPHDDGPHT